MAPKNIDESIKGFLSGVEANLKKIIASPSQAEIRQAQMMAVLFEDLKRPLWEIKDILNNRWNPPEKSPFGDIKSDYTQKSFSLSSSSIITPTIQKLDTETELIAFTWAGSINAVISVRFNKEGTTETLKSITSMGPTVMKYFDRLIRVKSKYVEFSLKSSNGAPATLDITVKQYRDLEILTPLFPFADTSFTDDIRFGFAKIDVDNELQVDVLSMPAVTISGTPTVKISQTGDENKVDLGTSDLLKEATALTEATVGSMSIGTEYSYAIPANTKWLMFRAKTEGVDIYYAFTTGKVATPLDTYYNLRAGEVATLKGVNLSSKTLYLATPITATKVEILSGQ